MAERTVALMTEADLDELAALEKACFAVPWSRASLAQELSNPLAVYLIVRQEGVIAAYIGCWIIMDEAHFTNLAVSPLYRRQGIAWELLQYLLVVLKQRGVKSATLEVRVSNQAARSLYEKIGFKEAGIRPGYYADNGEDALIMWLERLDEK